MLQEVTVSFTFAYLFIYLKYKIGRKNLLSLQVSKFCLSTSCVVTGIVIILILLAKKHPSSSKFGLATHMFLQID